MMLNALSFAGVAAPTEAALSPYPYFTEATMFTSDCVKRTPTHLGGSQPLDARFVATYGATLQEWVRAPRGPFAPHRRCSSADAHPHAQTLPRSCQAGYLSCYANVNYTFASQSSVAALRQSIMAAFSSVPPSLVAVNFHREPLGMIGTGHMSPIGAYDNRTDRMLMLDVSRYKYPPTWIPATAMFAAMNTTDSSSGKSRGWVVVSAPKPGTVMPPLPAQPPEPNGTRVRQCISSIAVDDPSAVARCAAGGAPIPPPPPPFSCPPMPPPCGGGGGALTTITIILAMMTVMLGALLYQEKKLVKRMEFEHEMALAPNGNIGGMSGPIPSRAARESGSEHEGVAMLPR